MPMVGGAGTRGRKHKEHDTDKWLFLTEQQPSLILCNEALFEQVGCTAAPGTASDLSFYRTCNLMEVYH